MRTFGTLLHATSDTATALLNTGSIAVAVGATAAAYTQNLRTGLMLGAVALVLASAAFGFSIWRTYRPQLPRRILLKRRRTRKQE